ncbi:alkaline phosphatase [Bacillus sp. MUM 116]|uniref:alkaline phosphatase n=1 Tax=Bacillus sp. MUM 116 TaxID=1678002 RepID=UPI0008F58983|nr:alkaline phosphatase [Bacillus sp. MUM 116]OIK16840.1 alkaline phosphatase [Bacillus sp. MUM 116]
MPKRILAVATISLAIAGIILGTIQKGVKANPDNKEIRNIIFLIGDGMGVSYTTAYRYFKDDPATKKFEPNAFDPYLVGQQMTYSDDPNHNVTDSAAAGTAMATGVKTYNSAVGVDRNGAPVKSVLEAAKEKGKSTGLVVTSQITHATPAAFGAHEKNRKNMDAIADDYFDEKIHGQHKIDVMLGGGLNNLVRSERDLRKEFQKDGYDYATTKDEMLKSKKTRLLGLFATEGLPKMLDREASTPSLKEMTETAISKLSQNDKGFFLMVEGSQIDWAGHDNDIVAAMSEMEDFEKAFKAAIDFAKKDKHTLVVATADHSTGGFSVGAKGNYNWFAKPIAAAKHTPDFMAKQIEKDGNIEQTLKNNINLSLTPEEIKSVKKASVTKNVTEIDNAIEKIFDTRSVTGWTTSGHTGDDVNIYAYGPGRDLFMGKINNTDMAKNIFEIIKSGE